jgi:hypothetical protein
MEAIIPQNRVSVSVRHSNVSIRTVCEEPENEKRSRGEKGRVVGEAIAGIRVLRTCRLCAVSPPPLCLSKRVG